MRHEKGYLQGAQGERIFHQSWLPEVDPCGVVILVHGLAEHSGRYSRVIEPLIPNGYALFGLDHIGHGKSSGTRVFVESFSDFVDILDLYVEQVRTMAPGVPVFLYGHSMGALILANYLLEHADGIRGAVFTGPFVKVPENISSGTILLARILSRIAPKLRLAPVGANGISRNPEVVQAYLDDPLVYCGKTTARLGSEILNAMRRIEAQAQAIQVPSLILQGESDFVVDSTGAAMLHERLGAQDKTLKVYPGLYHEIHNEPEHSIVMADVVDWLTERC